MFLCLLGQLGQVTVLEAVLELKDVVLSRNLLMMFRNVLWPGLQWTVDGGRWALRLCSRVTRNVGEVHKVLCVPQY